MNGDYCSEFQVHLCFWEYNQCDGVDAVGLPVNCGLHWEILCVCVCVCVLCYFVCRPSVMFSSSTARVLVRSSGRDT